MMPVKRIDPLEVTLVPVMCDEGASMRPSAQQLRDALSGANTDSYVTTDHKQQARKQLGDWSKQLFEKHKAKAMQQFGMSEIEAEALVMWAFDEIRWRQWTADKARYDRLTGNI